jgi:hypothetical protein
MTTAAVFEARPRRAPFRERVMALAGRGGVCEPTAGGGSVRGTVPPDHMVAAALAFGRRDRADVGPDIAMAMATGRLGEAHTLRVLRWLGGLLAGDRSAACRRLRPWAGHYALWAFNAAMRGWQVPPAPEGVADDDHATVLLFAYLLLEQAAEDALALAARRWRA